MKENRTHFISFTFNGKPVSKSNGYGAGKGRFFIKSKALRNYEESLHIFAIEKMEGRAPTSKLVELEVVYFLPDKKVRDLPNLPKTTTDALQEAIYINDFQIHKMKIERKLSRENPRIEVSVYEVEDGEWSN